MTTAIAPPIPLFPVGSRVICQHGAIGIVTEVRRWPSRVGYRVRGDGFHPRHFYAEGILSDAESHYINVPRHD